MNNKNLLNTFGWLIVVSLAYITFSWALRMGLERGNLLDAFFYDMGISMFVVSALGTFGLFAAEPKTPKLLVASRVFLFLTVIAVLSFFYVIATYGAHEFWGYVALSGIIWITCSLITSLVGLFYKKGFYWTLVLLQFLWGAYVYGVLIFLYFALQGV